MQKSMSIESLLNEVIRQNEVKRDFITDTKTQLRLVQVEGAILAEMLTNNVEQPLARLTIAERAHQQIALWLKIPTRFYDRMRFDHPDLIVTQVNALFEREPGRRMCRTLDGEIRAFMSDQYKRIDNKMVLENSLPSIIHGDVETQLLSSNITPHRMDLKILFTDDSLAHEVTKANNEPRIIRPGFRMSNSETGGGSFNMQLFFYDSYCTNGCVYGQQDMMNFSRRHLGAKIDEKLIGQNLLISDKTATLENELIVSQVCDAIASFSDRDNVANMAEQLKAAANSARVQNPVAAVEAVAQELSLNEKEKDSMLVTFLRDRDYSKWGMASAITEIANNETIATYSRANELEELGGKLLNFNAHQWQKFVNAEKVAA